MKVAVITPDRLVHSAFIHACLDAWHEEYGITRISHAGRTAGDRFVYKWARKVEIPQVQWKFFWREHQEEDVYVRDLQMIRWDQPDYVLGFPAYPDTDDRVLSALQLARRYDFATKTFDETHVYDLSVLQKR